jgi:putative DNA primase/helicase
MTIQEREAHRRRMAELRRIREEEERQRHAEVAQQARILWDRAELVPSDHAYLVKKQVSSHGLRLYRGDLVIAGQLVDGALIVPLHDPDGTLCSLEFISTDSTKLFLPGARKRGASYLIGTIHEVLCIVEGYATGASVHEATGHAVAVAFDAGNLKPVAEAIRAKYPAVHILICGDHDANGTGQTKAQEAAKAVGGLAVVPERKCMDWNDVHRQQGPDAVQECITAALATPSAQAMDRVTYRRVADIPAKPIHWLWEGRIARGKVSMLAGNPGLGKSQVTASMAAIVSTGGNWPVDKTPCEVGNVVILSAEDDPADTIRPRLEAAGADLSRVFIIDAVVDGTSANGGVIRRGFNLKSDLSRLGAMLGEIGGAALIIIDPITAYLGTTDSHKNAEIRALLSPLAELAAKQGAAVVCVSHFNKNGNGVALMRVTGSLAFVAAARAAFVVARDPDHEDRRLFLPLKNNLGNDQIGLAFTVEPVQLESAQGSIETSHVLWESGTVTISADEAMTPQVYGEERGELEDAKDLLRGLLADGAVSSKQIRMDAEGAGHAWRTIQRAQKALGVIAFKDGMKGGWLWRLDTYSRPEDRQDIPKSATPGEWQSSHSSGEVGGLRIGHSEPLKGTPELFRPELASVTDEAEEVSLW